MFPVFVDNLAVYRPRQQTAFEVLVTFGTGVTHIKLLASLAEGAAPLRSF